MTDRSRLIAVVRGGLGQRLFCGANASGSFVFLLQQCVQMSDTDGHPKAQPDSRALVRTTIEIADGADWAVRGRTLEQIGTRKEFKTLDLIFADSRTASKSASQV